MSTISRSNGNRRDIKCKSIHLLGLLIVINCATAIDYAAYRRDRIPQGTSRHTSITTRDILKKLNRLDGTVQPTLQDATEHLLEYGALLRIQILDTFGKLVYDHYDDYGMDQIEALYRIYRDTLERSYNIFDIVPSVLDDPDTRPTKICAYINKYVRTCLKESSSLCMNIKIHDEPPSIDRVALEVLNLTSRIYRIGEISANYPNGFTLQAIVDHLRSGRIRFTTPLLSGLFRNVRYDQFDDRIRTAERDIIAYLDDPSRAWVRWKSLNLFNDWRTVGQMLRKYLTECGKFFKGKAADEAAYLSKHVVREVRAVSENIELLGTVYDNSTINLKYLFELILPNDGVDSDIVEARDYLLRQVEQQRIVETYLDVEKYQQAGPDQLLLEILGQLEEIGFAEDLARALHVHARFWHKSHMIENLNELLGLFEAYENLRVLPQHRGFMMIIDSITNSLYDTENVTVELLCSRPRDCLRQGLEIVAECPIVNDETKGAIRLFIDRTTRGCLQKPPILKTIEVQNELSIENEDPMESDENSETTSESVETVESSVIPVSNTDQVEELTIVKADSENSSGSEASVYSEAPSDSEESESSENSSDTEESENSEGSGDTEESNSSQNSGDTEEPESSEDSGDTEEPESLKAESSEENLPTMVELITEHPVPSTTERITKLSIIPEPTETNESSATEESDEETTEKLCRRTCASGIITCDPDTHEVSNNRCDGCKTLAEKMECMAPCCSFVVTTTPANDPCQGLDCSGADRENCKFLNCTLEMELLCDGNECSDESLSTDCEGSDCQDKSLSAENLITCQGPDCSQDESVERCEGDDCDSKTAESTSTEICEDENCSAGHQTTMEVIGQIEETPTVLPLAPSVDEVFSSTIAMIACNNSDPNYQRQLSRLQKMRIIDVLLSKGKSSNGIVDSRYNSYENSETIESEEESENAGNLKAHGFGNEMLMKKPHGKVYLKYKDSADSSMELNHNENINFNAIPRERRKNIENLKAPKLGKGKLIIKLPKRVDGKIYPEIEDSGESSMELNHNENANFNTISAEESENRRNLNAYQFGKGKRIMKKAKRVDRKKVYLTDEDSAGSSMEFNHNGNINFNAVSEEESKTMRNPKVREPSIGKLILIKAKKIDEEIHPKIEDSAESSMELIENKNINFNTLSEGESKNIGNSKARESGMGESIFKKAKRIDGRIHAKEEDSTESSMELNHNGNINFNTLSREKGKNRRNSNAYKFGTRKLIMKKAKIVDGKIYLEDDEDSAESSMELNHNENINVDTVPEEGSEKMRNSKVHAPAMGKLILIKGKKVDGEIHPRAENSAESSDESRHNVNINFNTLSKEESDDRENSNDHKLGKGKMIIKQVKRIDGGVYPKTENSAESSMESNHNRNINFNTASQEEGEKIGKFAARELGQGNLVIGEARRFDGRIYSNNAESSMELNHNRNINFNEAKRVVGRGHPIVIDSAESSSELIPNNNIDFNTIMNKNVNGNTNYRKMIIDRHFTRAPSSNADSNSSTNNGANWVVEGSSNSNEFEAGGIPPPSKLSLLIKKGVINGGIDKSSRSHKIKAEKIQKSRIKTSGNGRAKENAGVSGGGKRKYGIPNWPSHWRYASGH